jgi:ribosome-binding factor A
LQDRRTARIAEAIREELSQMLNFEVKDPRLGAAAVADVRVTPDGREAHIQVILYGDEKEGIAALEHARGHLRHELAGRLNLRHVPELFFATDTGTAATARVEELLKRVKRSKK